MASEKVAQLIEEVKVLSVLELSELVHVANGEGSPLHLGAVVGIQAQFGSHYRGSRATAVAAAPAAGGAAPAADEKTEFDVVLAEVGASKMGVIKIVKEITGLGLKESKELVDNAPKAIKEGVGKDEAEETGRSRRQGRAEVRFLLFAN